MQKTKLFNPQGDDRTENRKMWFGDTTNLMQLNDVRYSWAIALYQQMRQNFWIPQKIDLTQDITDYGNLTEQERRAYDGMLSYLTFLDSIQTCNLPNLKSPITAPEVSLCIAEQISQEAMHNQSYQYIIETIIPPDRRIGVYEKWREDEILAQRCKFIAETYEQFLISPEPRTYFNSLLANYILEGIYFMNGFIFFYNLASRMLMPGTADMFKMINRDELSHVRLYQKMLPEAIKTFGGEEDYVYGQFALAVEQEVTWSRHIIGNEVLGITYKSIEDYTKHLANIRLRSIGLKALFPEVKASPYKHLEKLSDTKSEGTTKANFFEASVTSYTMSSGVDGWDEI